MKNPTDMDWMKQKMFLIISFIRYNKYIFFLAFSFLSNHTFSQIRVNALINGNLGNGIYTDMHSVFQAINNGTIKGDIKIKIFADFNDQSSISLNKSGIGLSNYNSITITPDDTCISQKIISTNFWSFDGCKNILIDGKSLFNNQNNIIKIFGQPSTGASLIEFKNGTKNCIFQNCELFVDTSQSQSFGLIRIKNDSVSLISDSILILNNKLYGGNYAISLEAQNLIKHVEFSKNEIQNFKIIGINNVGFYQNLNIFKNSIFHSKGYINIYDTVYGIVLKPRTNTSIINIINNRIYRLKVGVNTIFGIYINPKISLPQIPTINIINNSILLLDSSSAVNKVNYWDDHQKYGIYYTNLNLNGLSCSSKISIINNSIIIYLYYKFNNPSANSFNFFSNINYQDTTTKYLLRNNYFTCIGFSPQGFSLGCACILFSNSQSIISSDFNNIYDKTNYVFYQPPNYNQEQHSTYKFIPIQDSINPYFDPLYYGDSSMIGTPLAEVPTDIDGNPRHPVFPHKGAWEAPATITAKYLAADKIIQPFTNQPSCPINTITIRLKNIGTAPLNFTGRDSVSIWGYLSSPSSNTQTIANYTYKTGILAIGDSVDVFVPCNVLPDTNNVNTLIIYTHINDNYWQNDDTAQLKFNANSNYPTDYGDSAVNGISFVNNSGLVANNAQSLNISSSNVSIEFWTKRLANKKGILFAKDSSTYAMTIDSLGYISFTTKTNNGQVTLKSNFPIELNQWTHVAGVYDGAHMYIYLNGNLTATGNQSGNIVAVNTPTFIIGNQANGQLYYNGIIDEMKVWESARSATQIRTGMHTRYATGAQTNLLAYWRLDESTNLNYYTDASQNCNNLKQITTTKPLSQNSDYPLQNGVVSSLLTTGGNTYTFGNTNLRMQFVGQSGTNTVTVHKINGQPQSTLPNSWYQYPTNYWIMYVYGTNACTQLNLTFTISSNLINKNNALNAYKLFGRSASSGGIWSTLAYTASNIDTVNNRITFSITYPYPSSAQFTVGYTPTLTPVTLLSFTAQAQHKDVHLQWETVNEINNKGFYILESTIPEALRALAFVPADDYSLPAAVLAIHESPQRYTYTHANALSDGQTHYYQLKQIDNDGQYSLSKIIAIQPTQLINEDNVIVYPNPFNESLIIETNSNETQHVQLIGMDGRVWMETELTSKMELDVKDIPAGFYVLRNNLHGISIKLVKIGNN